MERIEGMVSDIVFKNEDNGYTIAHLANSDNEIVIVGCMPTLLISLYHRSRDIFYLVNFVRERYPEYKLYLRRLRCLPAWEIDLIAVKK